jgi:hypothetical protein
MTHQFDDYETEIQSDELPQGEYWDEYVEYMEGEEIPLPDEYDPGEYEPSDDDWSPEDWTDYYQNYHEGWD